MRDISEPEIFLQDLDEHVEIVIKLSKPNDILPIGIWKMLKKDGLTLSRVFDALLWQKIDKDRGIFWTALAGPAVESYRQLWPAFFRMAYLDQFHPVLEPGLKELEREIASEGKTKQKLGRPSAIRAEIVSIEKRYKELLPTCVLIHDAAKAAMPSPKTNTNKRSLFEIRRLIFEHTRQSIHGLPFVSRILGGEAFTEYRCGLKHAHLHDPQSWRPHNLAISLLTFERSQKWETLEKKLRRQKAAVATPSPTRI
jgi:hypothetical protein